MNPYESALLTLACMAITAFVTHSLTKDRDVATRKTLLDREADLRRRNFRKQLLRWRFTLERTPHDQPQAVWDTFKAFAPDLLAEAAMIQDDYVDPRELSALIAKAGEWRRDQLETEAAQRGLDMRDLLKEAICKLYDFLSRPGGIVKT